MKLKLSASLVLVMMLAALASTGAWAVTYLEDNFDSYAVGTPLRNYWDIWTDYNNDTGIGNNLPLGDEGTDHCVSGILTWRQSLHLKNFTPGTGNKLYVLKASATGYDPGTFNGGVGLGSYAPGPPQSWSQRGMWYYMDNQTQTDYVTGQVMTGAFWHLDLRYLLTSYDDGCFTWLRLPEADNAPVTLWVVVDQVNMKTWGVIQTVIRTITLPEREITTTDYNVNAVAIYEDVNEDTAPNGIDVDDVRVTDTLPTDGTITGSITLEDFKGNLSSAPVKVHLVPTSGGAEKTETITLTSNPGPYLVSSTAGTYDISYSACEWKTLVKTGVVLGVGGEITENASLVNGDVDGNNAITNNDVSVVLKNLE